ncbi:MAG: histidinol-phosphate transaminase [Candidatus Omnitrophica bacterium]|nr:histidinol-phosphate transaminase [Candidatus Omnitrophota bacterium]
MADLSSLARPSHKYIQVYVPGKPIEEVFRRYGLRSVIKLASNENPLGPSPRVIKALRENLKSISRYPEGSAYYLKKELARHLRLKLEELIITSGSSEAISLCLQVFVNPGEEVVFPRPSFLIYPILCHMIGAIPVEVPLNNDFSYEPDRFLERITERTKVLILCNPNNPTGTILTRKQIEYLWKHLPQRVVVISDEAYAEYVESKDYGSALDFFRNHHILIARTFSKIYALAGLRIGYGIASAEMVNLLERIRPPFNTTGLAQLAARVALGDKQHVRRSKQLNTRGKRYLFRELSRLGISCLPTEANFILCDFKRPTRELVKKLERRGMLIRPRPASGLGENFARITIGTMAENKALVNMLKQLL